MRSLWIFITDKTNVIVLDQDGIQSLPCQKHWPTNRPAKRNNMSDALFSHILSGLEQPECNKVKMKRLFGMPPKSALTVYECSPERMTTLVKDHKRIRQWFTRHAACSPIWKLKSIPISTVSEECDVVSGHISKAIIEMN